MAKLVLNSKSVSRAVPASGQVELWDSLTPGFGLRIAAGGARTFFVMRRLRGGKLIRRSIGQAHIGEGPTCLDHPEEAEEGSSVALVVLHPRTAHDARADTSSAMAAADDALKRRSGGRLRQARNTLIFVAAETSALLDARKAAKLMLAWKSIRDDKALDLKASQKEDAEKEAESSQAVLNTTVRRAWSQIILPAPPKVEGEPYSLDRVAVRNTGAKSVAQTVWEKVSGDGSVQEKLGQITLSERISAAWPADAAHIPVSLVRDWFVQYVRFERLRDEVVLAEAIGEMLRDLQPAYAFAEGVDAEGRYQGLVLGKTINVRFDVEALLVNREAAQAQIAKDAAATGLPAPQEAPGAASPGSAGGDQPAAPEGAPGTRNPRRFHGVVELNPDRPIPNLQQITESVIAELQRTRGVKVTLRLDIEATAPDGFPPDDVSIIRGNTRTLKFDPGATDFSDD